MPAVCGSVLALGFMLAALARPKHASFFGVAAACAVGSAMGWVFWGRWRARHGFFYQQLPYGQVQVWEETPARTLEYLENALEAYFGASEIWLGRVGDGEISFLRDTYYDLQEKDVKDVFKALTLVSMDLDRLTHQLSTVLECDVQC